jgi:hypothetical protein
MMSPGKEDQKVSGRREIEIIFTRLLDQINSARGSVQKIARKDQISTSSQKVVETWSQELKDIARKRDSRISLMNASDAGIKASQSNGQMRPRGMVLTP